MVIFVAVPSFDCLLGARLGVVTVTFIYISLFISFQRYQSCIHSLHFLYFNKHSKPITNFGVLLNLLF